MSKLLTLNEIKKIELPRAVESDGPMYMSIKDLNDQIANIGKYDIAKFIREGFPAIRICGEFFFEKHEVLEWFKKKKEECKNPHPLVDWRTFRGEVMAAKAQLYAHHQHSLPPQNEPSVLRCMSESLKAFNPFPPCPVVYFLIRSGTVVYVGQSINLSGRIQQHEMDRAKVFDLIRYIEVSAEDSLDKVEAAFISALKPKINRRHPKLTPEIREILKRYGAEGLIDG